MSATLKAYELALFFLKENKYNLNLQNKGLTQDEIADIAFEFGRIIVHLEDVYSSMAAHESKKETLK